MQLTGPLDGPVFRSELSVPVSAFAFQVLHFRPENFAEQLADKIAERLAGNLAEKLADNWLKQLPKKCRNIGRTNCSKFL